jgi:hypothetical protein
MSFKLSGLDARQFEQLWGLSDRELATQGATRLKAESGFPDRISLRDIPVGDSVLLLNFEHLGAPSAYRAAGPIFVREGERRSGLFENHLPSDMLGRLYSIRAYDQDDWMVDAEVVEGRDAPTHFERMFDSGAAYLHLHHARRGCFACRVDRVEMSAGAER